VETPAKRKKPKGVKNRQNTIKIKDLASGGVFDFIPSFHPAGGHPKGDKRVDF